jgi:glycosyltransferase involved in cell wall biosynthesis
MVQGRRLTEVFGDLVPQSRIAVIPNGVEDHPLLTRWRNTKGEPGDVKTVLFIGLMCREKGFHDVIASIPLVPDATFVFAGEWASERDEAKARDFVMRHGVARRTQFVGVVSGETKARLFAAADVFVFPSYFAYEGHAVSSVEALAAGLPIVCTDHGALNESVIDGWNGYFIPRSDPEAIARRLNELLGDEALRQRMGRRGRQLYEERMTSTYFSKAWVRAVLSVVSHPSGAA